MIGICIKYFHENYGGMLQAYATTKILEKKNINYEIIRYEKKKNLIFMIKSIPRLFNSILLNDKIENIKKRRGYNKHPEFRENYKTRMEAFKRFKDSKFNKLSEIYHGYDNLCKGAEKYDAIITGSDQLWSPAGLPTNFYNLMFVPNGVKKISYASSFGVKQIPWYQKSRTKKFLDRIDFISVRENRGSEIVKELTGRKVPTVLDPVFMLSKKEWEIFIPPKKVINDRYIFAYFLGDNIEYRDAVTKTAKELNCKIVALRHLDQYVESDEQFGDYAPYDIDPADFLNLLRNAEYVCTDSFHGSVFSIIHHKKFITFNRYSEKAKHSKNSRIDTLCENLSLKERRFIKEKNLTELLVNEIDYQKVDKKLDKLKEKADKYLNDALKK